KSLECLQRLAEVDLADDACRSLAARLRGAGFLRTFDALIRRTAHATCPSAAATAATATAGSASTAAPIPSLSDVLSCANAVLSPLPLEVFLDTHSGRERKQQRVGATRCDPWVDRRELG
ncbi:hypothetical protein Agub_g11201, partial [Astrephomene gubernaculifera]